MKFLISILSVYLASNMLSLIVNHEEKNAFFITTPEDFNNLPTITTDAYPYLKNVPVKVGVGKICFCTPGRIYS